ncbi:hypothetical protein [Arthrobacter sp. MYb214]|uniref:hypothetical protein n=1 Tax=Arthrobacter sp. MYb214 TaxID=1848596 RepID=UPI0011B0AFD8|nr:hypothetical protein [Arthrobacter sp. MYb214]
MKNFPAVIWSNNKLDSIDDLHLSDNCYFYSESNIVHHGKWSVLGFQGNGVLNEKFVKSNSDLFEQLLPSLDTDEPVATFSSSFRGAGIAYLKNNSSHTLYALPDLLGEAILFHYSNSGVDILTGDLQVIEKLTARLNLPLTKSINYALELSVSSNGGFTKSSYIEVSTLDMLQYATVSRSGISINYYEDSKEFFNTKLSAEELLDLATIEIQQNVRAAANSGSAERIAHLTGGFDSRLVLAAAKSQGVVDQFRFFCKGDPVQEDTKIAQSAAAKVGAIMTLRNGTPSDYQVSDYGGALLSSMLVSSGILPTGPSAGHQESDVTLLSGGYGETFRSFYGTRIGRLDSGKLTGEYFGSTIWGPYLFSPDGSGLFSSKFISSYASKIDAELDKGRKLGVAEDDLPDFLYLQIRNRYFVGVITSNWNRYINRFDPLYSPSGIKLAFKLGLKKRMDNLIGFELMKRMCEPLLSVPFDSIKFGESVTSKHGYTQPISYNHVRPKFDDASSSKPLPINSGVLAIPKTTKEDVEYAKKIKSRASQIAGRAHARQAVSLVIRTRDQVELAKIFNLNEIDILVKRPANTRVRIRTLYALLSSFLWLSDEQNSSRLLCSPKKF